jgi:hypothetical protein
MCLCACNAIVGIDSPEAFDQDGAVPSPDGGGHPMMGDAGTRDGSLPPPPPGDGGGEDVAQPEDAPQDHGIDAPPPSNGKAGQDVTAGGTWGKSTNYKMVAAAGESPGGNNVGSSTHYVLKAGVIVFGQSN